MKSIRVIGAGMNGLLSAFYLLEKGYKVQVYEKSDRVGGKVQTLEEKWGLREKAANAVIVDQEIERVASLIGVELVESSRESRARWIFRESPKRWPLGFFATMKLLWFVVQFLFKSNSIRPKKMETLRAWGERALGVEALNYLFEPMCLGIFGAESEKLSAQLIFNYFFDSPKRTKGRLRGSVAPFGGMGEFAKKLRLFLESKGVQFILQSQEISIADGQETVIATDISSAVELLKKTQDPRGEMLAQLPQVDLVSVNAFFEKQKNSLKGFGVLFPRNQGVAPLGVLFNGSIFEHMKGKDCESETWIFGGLAPSETRSYSDQDLLQLIESARSKKLKKEGHMVEAYLNRWPQAIALYGLELEQALEHLPQGHKHIHLIGNYLGEIGIGRFFHRARTLTQSL